MRLTSAHWSPRAVAVAASVGLWGCGGGSPTNPTDQLTEAEIVDLAGVLASLGDLSVTLVDRPIPPGLAPHSFVQLPTPIDCPLGGSAIFAGSVDENDLNGSLLIGFQETFEACAAAAPGSIRTFVLDGTLGHDLSFEVLSPEATTFDLDQAGSLSWSTAGKAGRCQVSINVVATVSRETGQATGMVAGTLCGASVNETLTF